MSQWHCKIGDRQYGPISTRELKELADTGKLQPTDLLKKDGTTSWAHASAVRGLFGGHEHAAELGHGPVKTAGPESPLRSPPSPPAEQIRASDGPADVPQRRKLSTRDKLGVAAIGLSLVLIVAAIGFAIGSKPRRPNPEEPIQVAAKASEPPTSVPAPVKPPAEIGATGSAEAGTGTEPQIAQPSSATNTDDRTAAPLVPEPAGANGAGPLGGTEVPGGDAGLSTPDTGNRTPEPPPENPMPEPTPQYRTPEPTPENVTPQPAPKSPTQTPPVGFPGPGAAGAEEMGSTPLDPPAATKPPAEAEAESDGRSPPDPRDDAYCQQVQKLFEQTGQLLTELRANQVEVRKIMNDYDQAKLAVDTAAVEIPRVMMQLDALFNPPPGRPMKTLEQRRLEELELRARGNMLLQSKQNNEKRLQFELPRKMREAESNVIQVSNQCDAMLPQWLVLSDPFAEQSRAAHVRVAEMCVQWLAGERDFIGGYLMRGFAHWHARQADQASKEFDQVVQGCQALQTVQVSSDAQVVPGGQGRKLTKNEQEVLAAALSGQAVLCAEMGQEAQSKAKCGEAADLCPKSALVCVFRGRANALLGKTRAAIDDLLKATKLDSKEPAGFRELARLLATSPTLNEGKRAVDFGHTACQLTDWKQWQSLDAYALANAKNGTFEEAVKWGQKTLEIAPYDVRPGLEERLKLYQARVVPTNVKSR